MVYTIATLVTTRGGGRGRWCTHRHAGHHPEVGEEGDGVHIATLSPPEVGEEGDGVHIATLSTTRMGSCITMGSECSPEAERDLNFCVRDTPTLGGCDRISVLFFFHRFINITSRE